MAYRDTTAAPPSGNGLDQQRKLPSVRKRSHKLTEMRIF